MIQFNWSFSDFSNFGAISRINEVQNINFRSFPQSEFCVVFRFLIVWVKRSTLTLKLNKFSRFKMVTLKIDEFVIFSTNFLTEVCNWAQVLVKRSPTLGTPVNTKTKCIKLIFIGKITLVPVSLLMVLSICLIPHGVLVCPMVLSSFLSFPWYSLLTAVESFINIQSPWAKIQIFATCLILCKIAQIR